jgi:methanogenic corrinoid protein MtbC1
MFARSSKAAKEKNFMSILIDTFFGIQCHADMKASVIARDSTAPTYDGRQTTVTKNEDDRKSSRGALHNLDAHAPAAMPMTSMGLSELATRALARMTSTTGAGEISREAKACMQSPMATALATALCDDKTDLADLMVEDLIDAGLEVEEVCLGHLAPAARCLGEWWETDRLPFTDVAMATARIQSMLRRMPMGRIPLRAVGQNGAVFCAVPGEQHTLGVMMAADLFRRGGWDVGLLLGLDHTEILDRLERDDRSVIGLSCSGAHSVNALERLMIALRKQRSEARIILSGQIAADDDALSRLPTPDAVVTSMEEAQACMDRLSGGFGDDMRRTASFA